jgi:hypothetical protein
MCRRSIDVCLLDNRKVLEVLLLRVFPVCSVNRLCGWRAVVGIRKGGGKISAASVLVEYRK